MIIFLLVFFFWVAVALPHYFIVLHEAKKCSYDCTSCKAWDCMGKQCLDKRNKS